MPSLTTDQLKWHNQFIKALEDDRSQWLKLWRELSDTYLPQRYRWLMSAKEYYANRARRQYIINNTGVQAARTLAAGMMNGITSPSRPWFKLRVHGLDLDKNRALAVWLEDVERAMMKVMAESNFYNSMAVLYLDMVVFGTGVVLLYEDRESVIRCYNPPLGEFFIANSDRMQVNIFARKFMLKVHQYMKRWPDERAWSDFVKNAKIQGGASLNLEIEIAHYIGPNDDNIALARYPYYEVYWEARRQQEKSSIVLEKRGFNELPGIFGRWEMSGNDAYGVGPGMDALGDNIELQHLHRNKAELLEKVNKPPVLADLVLQNNPIALMPKGVTYVPNLNNTAGVKPIYQVDPRFDQITMDKQDIEKRIRDTFYNFLFNDSLSLNTVRSAEEIRSRNTEKLILLGGVLERFESEGLDPAIKRVYSICDRAGLLPPPPPQYRELELDIQYVSILSIAQRAFGTAPTERFLGLIGNLAAVYQPALDIPKFDTLLRNYALDIGMRQSEINDQTAIDQQRADKNAAALAATAASQAKDLANAGKTLSQTDVGGGASALQRLMGG